MGQHQPFLAADDTAWLSGLVDTFARVDEMHDEPCSPAVVSAAMARLQRPSEMRRLNTPRRVKFLESSF